jgi:hypothetical protein
MPTLFSKWFSSLKSSPNGEPILFIRRLRVMSVYIDRYWCIMQSSRRQVVLPCCCAVLQPDIVLLQHLFCCYQDRERWVSIMIDNGVLCGRTEDKLSYRVVVQRLSQMLCSFSIDIVATKIESGECLYWSITMYYAVEQKTSCITVLLCSAWARCCAPSAPILLW